MRGRFSQLEKAYPNPDAASDEAANSNVADVAAALEPG